MIGSPEGRLDERRTRPLVSKWAIVLVSVLGATGAWSAGAPPASAPHTAAALSAVPTADAVLAELKAGNQHHAAHQYKHPHQSAARQRELAQGQHPHAVILACADSRVAPEIVFDQGLGDLFTIRVAGSKSSQPVLAELVASGKLRIVGAVYSLENGQVTWLQEGTP